MGIVWPLGVVEDDLVEGEIYLQTCRFENKFSKQNLLLAYVRGRFLYLSVYFFVTRIVLLTFAAINVIDYE